MYHILKGNSHNTSNDSVEYLHFPSLWHISNNFEELISAKTKVFQKISGAKFSDIYSLCKIKDCVFHDRMKPKLCICIKC